MATRRVTKTTTFEMPSFEKLSLIVVPLLTFLGGMAFNAYTIAEQIASKPYVDKGLEIEHKYTDEKAATVLRYTDEKTAQALKDSFNHSDLKTQEVLVLMEHAVSDIKSQGVKTDLVLQSVQQLQADSMSKQYRRR